MVSPCLFCAVMGARAGIWVRRKIVQRGEVIAPYGWRRYEVQR